jgi:hypothetical protein
MSESAVPAPVLEAADVDGVIQSVRFELYRENIYGALEIAEAVWTEKFRASTTASEV